MADFTHTPNSRVKETIEYDTLVSESENGVEQRRTKRSSARRTFECFATNQTPTELSTVTTMFNSKKGRYGSFTWNNPNDSTDYTVRFKEDSLRISREGYQIYDFEYTLIEVL